MSNENNAIHGFDVNLICDFFLNTERQGPGSPEAVSYTHLGYPIYCHGALRSRRSPFIRLVLHAEIHGQGILHTYNLITLFSRAPLRRLVQHADRLFRKRTVGGLERCV